MEVFLQQLRPQQHYLHPALGVISSTCALISEWLLRCHGEDWCCCGFFDVQAIDNSDVAL